MKLGDFGIELIGPSNYVDSRTDPLGIWFRDGWTVRIDGVPDAARYVVGTSGRYHYIGSSIYSELSKHDNVVLPPVQSILVLPCYFQFLIYKPLKIARSFERNTYFAMNEVFWNTQHTHFRRFHG